MLAISNLEGKTVALVNAPLTIGSRDAKSGVRLVFNQYDNEYFLSQVYLAASRGVITRDVVLITDAGR